MIYLSFLLIGVIYLYTLDQNLPVTNKLSISLYLLPLAFIYFVIPATQYDVGTDYFTYRNYYFNPDKLDIYKNKGEYVFYYIYGLIVDFELGSQAIFYFFSLINTLLFFVILYKLKVSSYKAWLIFFLFFVVTNIFHNQMNGIRQYVAVISFPLIFLYLVERKYLKTSVIFFVSLFSHASTIFSVIFIPFIVLSKIISKNTLFVIFLLSPFVYFLSGKAVLFIVENYLHQYSHYLGSAYATGISPLNFLTKLYYLPIFMLFWKVYLKDKSKAADSGYEKYMKSAITIWVFTYWLIVSALQFGFVFRLMALFIFFYIFPLYYYLNSLIRRRKPLELSFVLIYLAAPYVFKITVFAKGEYLYFNYLLR
jgi:hypothetical protein